MHNVFKVSAANQKGLEYLIASDNKNAVKAFTDAIESQVFDV